MEIKSKILQSSGKKALKTSLKETIEEAERTFLETMDPVIVSGDKDNMLEGFRRQGGGARAVKEGAPDREWVNGCGNLKR